MKRFATKHLKAWITNKNRKPLVLRGARQVGKSTLVKLFVQEQDLDLIEINLEKTKLNSVEQGDLNIQKILDEIQLKTQKRITSSTLIFFDEIQESPKLLRALRYFYEERPDLAVIAAGSLLEFILNDALVSFPVGRVEFYHLGPMTFYEFLMATDHHFLKSQLESLNFTSEVYQSAREQFKNYLYVGGMPYCVRLFAETKSLVEVRAAQEQILQTYIADFPKYNSRINTQKIQNVFFACANQLGKKTIYHKIEPSLQARDTKRILDLLINARVLLPCYHSDANSVPLAGECDLKIYKLYFLDIGLLNAITKLDLGVLDQEFKAQFNTKGLIAEQFIAQHLAYIGGPSRTPELFYWLRDKSAHKSEVDFVIQHKADIVAIEVKAKSVGHMKSLFRFAFEKSTPRAIKISLAEYSQEVYEHQMDASLVRLKLLEVPHFAVESLVKILGE